MNEHSLSAIPVGDYLDRLASGDPTPGGGSAAALAGSLAAALVSMVCNLTAGREKFAGVEQEVVAVRAEADAIRARLTNAIQADADAYGAVMSAYRLPRATDAERAQRSAARQAALHVAARVPMEIAEGCAEVLVLCDRAAGRTNPNAASDVTVAALLAGAAIEGGIANVQINVPLIEDPAYADELRARISAVRDIRDRLHDHVLERTRT